MKKLWLRFRLWYYNKPGRYSGFIKHELKHYRELKKLVPKKKVLK